ncbi:hypothetical protein BU26DRAFT_559212 [Trematosphaeria pertusa]|uniref:Uncharacterized protein n=1 Tax=Trematosphaeria pertusa TaxID=390896 RepID=A0A6A6IVT8_9PLEO|nr:uncharacterized protein BU26DRAFT_559212 [Trematosphaeria pertusa]KAF2254534.1 hypothetical protein BU26DRAFT_559212 [Trematosphaeria pertusa]
MSAAAAVVVVVVAERLLHPASPLYSRIQTYPYADGLTFRFVNCGILAYLKIPNEDKYDQVEDVGIHVLTNARDEHVKHNRAAQDEVLRRLREIVTPAGGNARLEELVKKGVLDVTAKSHGARKNSKKGATKEEA